MTSEEVGKGEVVEMKCCKALKGRELRNQREIMQTKGDERNKEFGTTSFLGDGGGLVAKSCLTLVTQRTVACQAPLSMGFSRQEYQRGLLLPTPGVLPNPGIKPGSPAL